MKKILEKIFVMIGLFFAFTGNIFASNNQLLDDLAKKDDKFIREIATTNNGYDFLLTVANSLINLFFMIAVVYFFIIIIKLVFAENSEEESSNFKKGFIWVSIGLMVIQISKVFVKSITSTKGDLTVASSNELSFFGNALLENIVKPLTLLLETGASFVFILIAIYAFYKLITSNGDESAIKNAKNTFLYSIIGFILIKVAKVLINSVYGECKIGTVGTSIYSGICTRIPELEGFSGIVTTIINWLNSFIGIGIIIMIIFVGLQIIFSNGDEEKLKSAKKSIIYIVIGIGILVMNYLIITFFNLPNIKS